MTRLAHDAAWSPRRMRGAALAGLIALAACGGETDPPQDDKEPCSAGYLGEKGAEIELQVTALDAGYASKTVRDGDTVDITTPPQGGRVVFVGVRATNLSACAVQLKGVIRDIESNKAMIDSRTINLRPSGDGWGTTIDTDISTFSNVSMCPNTWSARDLFDNEYELIVELKDRKGRIASAARRVTPVCSEPDAAAAAECRCICEQGYKTGEACLEAPDGGTPEG